MRERRSSRSGWLYLMTLNSLPRVRCMHFLPPYFYCLFCTFLCLLSLLLRFSHFSSLFSLPMSLMLSSLLAHLFPLTSLPPTLSSLSSTLSFTRLSRSLSLLISSSSFSPFFHGFSSVHLPPLQCVLLFLPSCSPRPRPHPLVHLCDTRSC